MIPAFLTGVTPGSIGIWTLVLGGLVAWFKMKPLMAKLQMEGNTSLRGDLLKRIAALEEQQIADRTTFANQRDKDREERDRDREEYKVETDALRDKIREQDRMIDGLQRNIIMFQVATGRALPLGEKSPEIEAMLAKLSEVYSPVGLPSSPTRKAAEDTCHAADLTLEQVKQDEAKK